MTQQTDRQAQTIWSASDIRQFVYCPRVIYFRYVMPLHFRQTYSMIKGTETEELQLLLTKRRSFQRWGLAQAELVCHPYWKSESLRLAGIPDAVLLAKNRVGVLEFKESPHGLTLGTELQLAVYTILAEELYPQRDVLALFHNPWTGRTTLVNVNESLKNQVLAIRNSLDELVLGERLPEPTRQKGKCVDCEYRRSCSDVLL